MPYLEGDFAFLFRGYISGGQVSGILLKQRNTVKIRGLADPVNLVQQLQPLRLDIFPGHGAIGPVGGLHGQCLHPLEHGVDFRQGAFPCIGHAYAVIYIAHGLVKPPDLAAHQFRNGQSGRVVPGPVNPESGG